MEQTKKTTRGRSELRHCPRSAAYIVWQQLAHKYPRRLQIGGWYLEWAWHTFWGQLQAPVYPRRSYPSKTAYSLLAAQARDHWLHRMDSWIVSFKLDFPIRSPKSACMSRHDLELNSVSCPHTRSTGARKELYRGKIMRSLDCLSFLKVFYCFYGVLLI